MSAGTDEVLLTRLREGRASTARAAAHFLPETVGRVRYAGARGQLTVRADGGFYTHAVVAVCRRKAKPLLASGRHSTRRPREWRRAQWLPHLFRSLPGWTARTGMVGALLRACASGRRPLPPAWRVASTNQKPPPCRQGLLRDSILYGSGWPPASRQVPPPGRGPATAPV